VRSRSTPSAQPARSPRSEPVSGIGDVVRRRVTAASTSRWSRHEVAARYLPPAVSEAYTDATDEAHGNNIAIVMRPERWNTSDFSDLAERFA
jgi:hypothetical protein